MWKKIKVWRKQLLCVGTGMFLGAAAWILQERDPVIKEGNVLERPAQKKKLITYIKKYWIRSLK